MRVGDQPWIRSKDLIISGTPTQSGTFDVAVTATGADGISTTNVFPLHVSPLLQRGDSFRPTDLINGTLDVPYSSRLSITGGVLPYTATIVAGQLPPGLTFNPATFEVTGTPTAAGLYSVDFEYEDAAGATLALRDYLYIDGTSSTGTINISTFDNLGTSAVGSFFSRTLTACCAPSYVWSAIDPLPQGLSLTADGLLSGTVSAQVRTRS